MKIYPVLREIQNEDFFTSESEEVYPDIQEKLKITKEFIDQYQRFWDTAKKQINDYEYVYTSSNPRKNICNVLPISRSYFKLREILFDLNIHFDDKIACIAEGPGGFVQSLLDIGDEQISMIHGITLISDDKEVPFWNQALLTHPKVSISKGEDGTGNIYDFKNILHFINEVGKESCSLVTSDGGFDYSNDFNNQEQTSLQLIYSEIFIALSILKEGGTFICKIFDIFNYTTLKLVYVLYQSFDEILFMKPNTSRLTNSEKYIVCKDFKGYNKEKSNLLCSYLIKDKIQELPIDVPLQFYNEIKRYNTGFTNAQITVIQKAIYVSKNRSLSYSPSQKQIKLGKSWCKKYNLPINHSFK